MENGMGKYGLMNWRDNDVVAHIYYDAAMRHLMSWWDGEDVAYDSKIKHLAHVMACCAILIDAEYNKNLIDDRPRAGHVADMIEEIHKERAVKASMTPYVPQTVSDGTFESGRPVIEKAV